MRQCRGRIDLGRGARDDHEVARACSVLGARDRIGRQHFVEPHDVGSQECAATRATRRLVRGDRVVPARDDLAVARAAHPRQRAVQLDDGPASRACVEAVDVLRRQQEAGDATLDRRERDMTRVGRRGEHRRTPLGVPVPHQLWIARERRGRGELERVEARPQSGERIAERRDARLGRHARAGQHDDPARACEGGGERRGDRAARLLPPVVVSRHAKIVTSGNSGPTMAPSELLEQRARCTGPARPRRRRATATRSRRDPGLHARGTASA
jgi:hypothetical protein